MKKFIGVAMVLGALGYAAWYVWRQNQDAALTWAAGTDQVD